MSRQKINLHAPGEGATKTLSAGLRLNVRLTRRLAVGKSCGRIGPPKRAAKKPTLIIYRAMA